MMEIFSIEQVIAANPRLKKAVVLEPMHTFRHQTRSQSDLTFWTATRHRNELGEREPSVMTISLVDLAGRIADPEADVLTVRTLCTNFDLPFHFSFGSPNGDFDAVGFVAKTITALRRPTQSLDPPVGDGQVWRLISLLSLNYLSLNEEGRTALQEILRLHNLTGAAATENQIGAIVRMVSSPHFAMVKSDFGLVPARGTLVEMELDEQQFAGAGAYLFSAVLDRFLAGYCSMNSFSQLTARTSQRKEEMARWPPRAGAQALL
jgi:type VI secretion system protein ImpG